MATNKKTTKRRSSLRRTIIIALWSITAIGVVSLTALFMLAKSEVLGPMPSFDELENPKTNLATQIFSADGEVLGTYFIENRTYLSYEEMFPADKEQWLEIDGRRVPTIVAAHPP